MTLDEHVQLQLLQEPHALPVALSVGCFTISFTEEPGRLLVSARAIPAPRKAWTGISPQAGAGSLPPLTLPVAGRVVQV